jgi:death-on-curing protein
VDPRWIPLELVLVIHDRQLAEHGGREGVHDLNALKSALERPQNLLAYGNTSTLFELAAVLAEGIAKNHPFIDGNKRTALVVAMSFLELNGSESDTDEESIAVIFEQLAEGKLHERQLSAWLEERAVGVESEEEQTKK